MKFKDIALRHKLMLTFTLFLVCTFVIGFFATLSLKLMNSRREMLKQFEITAALTADRVAASLTFDQPSEATDALKHLAADPNIRNVTIFKSGNKYFADYQRPGAPRIFVPDIYQIVDQSGSHDEDNPDGRFATRHRFGKDSLEVVTPIVVDGEVTGKVYISSDLSAIRTERDRTILLGFAINIPCVLLSLLLLRRTLVAISKPITTLASTAADVATKRDYSLRAPKFNDDELGQLADGFNRMLATIERQNETLSRQHAKLARATRMESLGMLAGGVAHDLNNILGPMVAFPDLIADRLEEGDRTREEILMIGKSARRASVVIQDLLSLARRGNYHLQFISLNDLLKECMESPSFRLRTQDHPGVRVESDLPDNLPPISGSESHLTQAILNLMINGLEAMGNAGSLTVSTRLEEVVTSPTGSFEKIEPRDYVVMSIADTGPGIKESDLDHIFEPFYSSKKMGSKSGSGLGLAVVYGVIKDHNAQIDVKSAVGMGTTFEIYFEPQHAAIITEEAKPVASGGSERILVVDDYEQQRILTERILQQQGYSTSGARGGREAVHLLQREHYDLIVLDMIMEEGFDGLDTYRECIKFKPGLKCIIATGFSENSRVKEALSLGASQCLHKPYTPTALGKAVREALDGTSQSQPAPVPA